METSVAPQPVKESINPDSLGADDVASLDARLFILQGALAVGAMC